MLPPRCQKTANDLAAGEYRPLAPAPRAFLGSAPNPGGSIYLRLTRSASETASALGIDHQRVTRCVRRVAAVGPLKAIDGLPRSGQRPELTEASRSWLIGEACAQPKDRGYPHELWTLRLLAIHPRCYGPLAGHACLA
jgi:hypothetical protein